MLSITTKSPYALKALTELGRQAATPPVPIGELARRRDIPVQFLEQLFAMLRRAGILKSQRGVKGGYSFARARSRSPCSRSSSSSTARSARGSEGIFAEAAAAARDVLEQTTHRRRRRARGRAAGVAMYYI